MPKRILIPTDFTVNTLRLVQEAVLKTDNPLVEVILFYCSLMPSSVTELRYFSPQSLQYQLSSPPFEQRSESLIKQFSGKLKSIKTEVVLGNSKRHLRNFLEAEDIHLIGLPISYRLQFSHPLAIDPLKLLSTSSVSTMALYWNGDEDTRTVSKDHLTAFISA